MPVDQRLKRPACRLLISSLFFPCLLLAQEYSVPKDEFGYPDFNGVWNSMIPRLLNGSQALVNGSF